MPKESPPADKVPKKIGRPITLSEPLHAMAMKAGGVLELARMLETGPSSLRRWSLRYREGKALPLRVANRIAATKKKLGLEEEPA